MVSPVVASAAIRGPAQPAQSSRLLDCSAHESLTAKNGLAFVFSRISFASAVVRSGSQAATSIATITKSAMLVQHGKPAPLIHIACTAPLRRMLDGIERTSPLILTTKAGQSFKKRYLNALSDKVMTKAGLESVNLPVKMTRSIYTSTTSAEPP